MKKGNTKERNYSKDYVECVFCGKSINLDSCNKHLNSKLCKKFQENNKNYEDDYYKFKKTINQVRDKIKNNFIRSFDIGNITRILNISYSLDLLFT